MQLLKNAQIMPLEGIMDYFTGGVFSSDGKFMEDSIISDRSEQPQLEKPQQLLEGVYIYGGCLFAHFGHCIWESLSRLYAIRECKEYPVLFIAPKRESPTALRTFFKSIGFTNEIVVVNTPVQVESLIYSSPGSSIKPLYVTDEQMAALQHFSFSPEKQYKKKIWLSRSRLLTGRVTNEIFIERILEKMGYEIIYPEELPFREQVRLTSTADVVAGFCGSAFYSLLFAKEINSTVVLFDRGWGIPDEFPYVLEKRGVEFSMHSFCLERVHVFAFGSHAADDYIHKEPEKVIEVLK